MVLECGVAHRIPYVISCGMAGDVFPAGCFAIVGFAADNICIDPKRTGDALASLCTARAGVPKRLPGDVHCHALFTFRPSALPPAIFAAIRAHSCTINANVPGKWNTARTSVAVHISELWHVLTAKRKCTQLWFAAHPRFVDLEGFLRVPVNPHSGLPVSTFQVRLIHNKCRGTYTCKCQSEEFRSRGCFFFSDLQLKREYCFVPTSALQVENSIGMLWILSISYPLVTSTGGK
jgi:hypothetical protein